MISLFWTLVVGMATAYATLAAGWLVVPFVALIGTILAPRGARSPGSVPLGVVLGWVVLLVRDARASGFSRLADQLVRLMPVSLPTLIGATLIIGLGLGVGGMLIGLAIRTTQSASLSR